MKKLLQYLTVTAVLLLAAVMATGCSQWDAPYKNLDKKGYTVSVRYDVNGGVFAGTKDVYVVDVFDPSVYGKNGEGKTEIPLLAPDDPIRKENAFSASNTGHFLAGWYTERTLRTDESGAPLDAYGELCSQSGRPQGYVYGGKWDFATDRLTVDPAEAPTSYDNTLTLYAAWVPYFNFEFYAVGDDGAVSLIEQKQLIEIDLPAWNEATGKLDMQDCPAVDGKTFEAAFLDAAMTTAADKTVGGAVDYEHGIISGDATVRLYTTWREGTWFRIYNEKQFYDNSRPGASYTLYADLDFEGKLWATVLSTGDYAGTIEGNGHTIRNVTVIQGDNSKINGGLFGQLTSTARISDVHFENVTFCMVAGARLQGPNYGLLAGTVQSGAVLENVTINGTIEIGKSCFRPQTYNIGLVAGAGTVEGIDHSGITVTIEDPANNSARVEVDETTGRVSLSFAE